MISLHVDLRVKPAAGPALEKTFRDVFRPAVSAQLGFVETKLLRPRAEADAYRLVIAFESEALRMKWVGTDLHQRVWPQMEAHCAGYEARSFEAV